MVLATVVVIVAAVLLLTWAARHLQISEPLLLLAGGCLIGLTPAFDSVSFPSELVLLLFLPALLYWEALTTSLREIRSNLRSITLQATGLVLVTAAAVAAVAHAMGFSWPVGFVLGAVLAPTDAVAVAAVAKGLPRRWLTMLRAESLINDGTALVLFAVAVDVAVEQHPFSLPGTTLRFVGSYAGGVAIGIAVAAVVVALRRRMREPVLQSALSVLTPFAAFLPAELAHVSGVLAVVTCGLILSQFGPRVIGSAARLQAVSFWEVTSFVLNGALFVMIGMQLPGAVRGLSSISLPRAVGIAGAVGAIVIGTRMAWFYTIPHLVRLLDRRPQQRLRRISARHRLPLAWAGMRGAVSLAAALAVPTTMANGLPLAYRDAIVFITVVVIVVTFVALGQPLPAVLRWARLPADTAEPAEEEMALRRIAEAALEALPRQAARLDVPEPEVAAISAELRAQADDTSNNALAERARLRKVELQHALLSVKRTALVRLRDERRIDDIVLRRIQELLDVEEVRLQEESAHAVAAAEGERRTSDRMPDDDADSSENSS